MYLFLLGFDPESETLKEYILNQAAKYLFQFVP